MEFWISKFDADYYQVPVVAFLYSMLFQVQSPLCQNFEIKNMSYLSLKKNYRLIP